MQCRTFCEFPTSMMPKQERNLLENEPLTHDTESDAVSSVHVAARLSVTAFSGSRVGQQACDDSRACSEAISKLSYLHVVGVSFVLRMVGCSDRRL
jgi:hypothetical protein